jgi:hypothetical protein
MAVALLALAADARDLTLLSVEMVSHVAPALWATREKAAPKSAFRDSAETLGTVRVDHFSAFQPQSPRDVASVGWGLQIRDGSWRA